MDIIKMIIFVTRLGKFTLAMCCVFFTIILLEKWLNYPDNFKAEVFLLLSAITYFKVSRDHKRFIEFLNDKKQNT